MAGGGIGEFGGGDGAVGIELNADADAHRAANGGARFSGNFGEDFTQDGGRSGIYVGRSVSDDCC